MSASGEFRERVSMGARRQYVHGDRVQRTLSSVVGTVERIGATSGNRDRAYQSWLIGRDNALAKRRGESADARNFESCRKIGRGDKKNGAGGRKGERERKERGSSAT